MTTDSKTGSSVSVAEQRVQVSELFETLHTKAHNAKLLEPGAKPIRKLGKQAMRHWNLILENTARGHLHVTDTPVLEQYCCLLVKLEDLTEQLVEIQPTLEDARTGREYCNPFFTAFATVSQQAMTLAQRLRLMPAMRQMSQAEKRSQDMGANPSEQPRAPSARSHLLWGAGHGSMKSH